MNRRSFLSLFGVTAAALAADPELALWTPGAKTISVPASVHVPKWIQVSQEWQSGHWSDEGKVPHRISFADFKGAEDRLVDHLIRIGARATRPLPAAQVNEGLAVIVSLPVKLWTLDGVQLTTGEIRGSGRYIHRLDIMAKV